VSGSLRGVKVVHAECDPPKLEQLAPPNHGEISFSLLDVALRIAVPVNSSTFSSMFGSLASRVSPVR
jgi:hypothetical protein